MAQPNNKLGELRPNQIITTFGPGAIIDAVKDSVTMLDTNYWTETGKKIIDIQVSTVSICLVRPISEMYLSQLSRIFMSAQIQDVEDCLTPEQILTWNAIFVLESHVQNVTNLHIHRDLLPFAKMDI